MFEVDFPSVAQRKAALIKANSHLKEWKPLLLQDSGGSRTVSGVIPICEHVTIKRNRVNIEI